MRWWSRRHTWGTVDLPVGGMLPNAPTFQMCDGTETLARWQLVYAQLDRARYTYVTEVVRSYPFQPIARYPWYHKENPE